MSTAWLPTLQQIKSVFVDAVESAGGRVTDEYADPARLYLRSVLPDIREARTGDRLQGGAALRAVDAELDVHPYVYRQVCRNGAIAAMALEARSFDRVQESGSGSEETLRELAEAVQACCSNEAFARTADQMRFSARGNNFINILPYLAGLSTELAAQVVAAFDQGRDRSLFGVINAITSVARDTRDPELRWRMEGFGGGIVASLEPSPQPDSAGAVCTR